MTLIMSEDRPQQIWDENKTLTCRPRKEGDRFQHATDRLPAKVLDAKMRTRWEVGKSYGIVPKRAHPVCLVDPQGKVVKDLHGRLYTVSLYADDVYDLTLKQARDVLLEANIGYRLLQVKLLEIKPLDVRDMTLAEARDEGFAGPGGDSVIGFWRFWCGTYDAGVLANGTVKEHHEAYEAGRCSWEQYYCLLESMVWQRPAHLYQAWMLRFQAVKP